MVAGAPTRFDKGFKDAMFVTGSYATTLETDAPAVTASVKVAVVMVSGSMASLKVALIVLLIQTPTAAVAGLVESTAGAIASLATPVVKFQLKALASGFPASSVTPVPSVATQVVLTGNAVAGTKVACLLFTAYPTVPVTGVPTGHATVNVVAESVGGLIASLKFAVISVFGATALAFAIGLVAVTVGVVVSRTTPVLKLQLKLAAMALLATSRAPVPMVATHMVSLGSATAGVNVAASPFAVYCTVPVMALLAGHCRVKVAVLIVSGSIGSLKLATTSTSGATPLADATGFIALTSGGVVSSAAPVVKLQLNALARALLAMSRAPVEMFATHVVDTGKAAAGVNVATLEFTATVPTTALPAGQATVNVAFVSVSGFICSLKVAAMSVLTAAPVAFAAGRVEVTVGAITSAVVPVVKLQLNAVAMALLAASFTPVEILALHVTPVGRDDAGVNVATLPLDA